MPVCKSSTTGKWLRIKGDTLDKTMIQHETGLEITFKHEFISADEKVYFAFTYPLSYEENQYMVDDAEENYKNDNEIYF